VETIMERKTLDQVGRVAEVRIDHALSTELTREQRLTRWAELLESQPERRLNTLLGTEYQSWETRETMRVADSPISVAYDDPVLRADGMKDDSYGEAKRYFSLSDRQLHEIVCYCHYGATMTAKTAAWRIRAMLSESTNRPDRLTRLRQALAL